MRSNPLMYIPYHLLTVLPTMLLAGVLALLPAGVGWAKTAPQAKAQPPMTEFAPPRIKALLEEAWSVEKYALGANDEKLAIALYCEAARFGNSEAHYRAGLLYLNGSKPVRNQVMAKSFLYNAMGLGHQRAANLLPELRNIPIQLPECLTQPEAYRNIGRFDFAHHVNTLSRDKKQIATLVATLAPKYSVPPELAVAIASVESGFNPQALSPRNAQGVMQLIPETAERFGVRDVWKPEENIRGGLAYLRWLLKRFDGNQEKTIAAYNAGEGAVDRYKGVPPYYETRSYVFRVTSYARTMLRRLPEAGTLGAKAGKEKAASTLVAEGGTSGLPGNPVQPGTLGAVLD